MTRNSPVGLVKGETVSLTKTDPLLKSITVGLGWDIKKDAQQQTSETFDLDAAILMTQANGQARSNLDFIYFLQQESICGSVQHTGDNRTGAGEGDDETINVFLDKVPADIHKLVVFVSIYDAEKKKQNFGQVSNAFVRLVNADTQQEVRRFDLSENASTKTVMVFAEIYRYENEWKFRAVEEGADSVVDLLRSYGINA